MNKPNLILMCGLPASGKSTLANVLKGNVLSSDKLREEVYNNINDTEHNEEVFEELYKRAKKRLLIGENVIIDATNITIKSRRKALSHFEDINCEKRCLVMATSYEDCINRNKDRERKVPEEVIKKMYNRFQMPFEEEGFDKVILTQNTGDNSYKELVCNKKFNNFDQNTKHHKYDLFTHSKILFAELCKSPLVNSENIDWLLRACLLHDYGKMTTQSFKEDDPNAHYYNHENVGAYDVLCNSYMENYKDIVFLINYHMLPFSWNTEKAQNKWRKIFGEEKYNLLTEFNRCDRIASGTEE